MVHCVRIPAIMKRKQALLYPVSLSEPNADCFACSSNLMTIKCNINTTTVGYFISEILQKQLALREPSVTVGEKIIYECGEEGLDDEEIENMQAQAQKLLKDVQVGHNTTLAVSDFSQDIEWNIFIMHDETVERDEYEILSKSSKLISSNKHKEDDGAATAAEAAADDENAQGVSHASSSSAGKQPVQQQSSAPAAAAAPAATVATDDDDELLILDDDEIAKVKQAEEQQAASGSSKKRKREEKQTATASSSTAGQQPDAKKQRQGSAPAPAASSSSNAGDDDDAIILD